jgi:hypothetical protein
LLQRNGASQPLIERERIDGARFVEILHERSQDRR